MRLRKKSYKEIRDQYTRIDQAIIAERRVRHALSDAREWQLDKRLRAASIAYGNALKARGMHYTGRNAYQAVRNPDMKFGVVAG